MHKNVLYKIIYRKIYQSYYPMLGQWRRRLNVTDMCRYMNIKFLEDNMTNISSSYISGWDDGCLQCCSRSRKKILKVYLLLLPVSHFPYIPLCYFIHFIYLSYAAHSCDLCSISRLIFYGQAALKRKQYRHIDMTTEASVCGETHADTQPRAASIPISAFTKTIIF